MVCKVNNYLKYKYFAGFINCKYGAFATTYTHCLLVDTCSRESLIFEQFR